MTQLYYSETTGGFYSDEIHGILGDPASTVPVDAVAITAAEHAALISAEQSGQVIVADGSGNPVAQAPALPSLDGAKATASAEVDAQAETARLQFMTGGVGQAMTYQLKYEEALAYAADASPDPLEYPFLVACIGADGASPSAVASTVIAARNLWEIAATTIEGTRRSAKMAITSAADHASITTIIDGLSWPAAS